MELIERVNAVTCNGALPPRRNEAAMPALLDALENGVALDATDGEGRTALHHAARCGATDLCRLLVEAGASVAVADASGAYPVQLAAFYASPEAAEEVHIEPPSLREAAALGDVPGMAARLEGDVRLEFDRPSEHFPVWERTGALQERLDEALTWASRCGQLEAMAWLVAQGADVAANPYRGTALLWATYAGRRAAIRWLVDRGAEVSQVHDFGGSEHGKAATALHLAAQFGDLETVELLVELGARWAVRDGAFGGTPREWAEHCGQVEVEMWLHEKGAP